MRIDRRSFIQSAALVATTQTLLPLLPLSSTSHSSPLPPQSPSPRDSTDATSTVFKIHGWNDGDTSGLTGNELVITVNRSWRAAWR